MSRGLSTEQQIAIGYLVQPNKGGKTYAEIAKECGVTEMTLWRWRQDDKFDGELRRQQRKLATEFVPDVMKALAMSAINEGNAAAGKLILQVAEQFAEKHEIKTDSKDAPDIDELKRLVAEIGDDE